MVKESKKVRINFKKVYSNKVSLWKNKGYGFFYVTVRQLDYFKLFTAERIFHLSYNFAMDVDLLIKVNCNGLVSRTHASGNDINDSLQLDAQTVKCITNTKGSLL